DKAIDNLLQHSRPFLQWKRFQNALPSYQTRAIRQIERYSNTVRNAGRFIGGKIDARAPDDLRQRAGARDDGNASSQHGLSDAEAEALVRRCLHINGRLAVVVEKTVILHPSCKGDVWRGNSPKTPGRIVSPGSHEHEFDVGQVSGGANERLVTFPLQREFHISNRQDHVRARTFRQPPNGSGTPW